MEAVGKALREIRVRQDCSLEELSRRTRISERVLSEMEEGDFHSIRGQFYRHHFIREYLRALGEDPASFLARYPIPPASYPAKESQAARTVEKIQVYRFRRRHKLGFLLLVLLLVVAAAFLFATNRNRVLSWFDTTPESHLAGAAFEPGWMQPGDRAPVAPRQTGSLCTWLDQETRLWGMATPPAAIHARFTSRCWAQVRRGGRPETSRIFQRGEELIVNGYDLQLSLGNPSVVKLTLNGRDESGYQSQNNPVTVRVQPFPPFQTRTHEPAPVP